MTLFLADYQTYRVDLERDGTGGTHGRTLHGGIKPNDDNCIVCGRAASFIVRPRPYIRVQMEGMRTTLSACFTFLSHEISCLRTAFQAVVGRWQNHDCGGAGAGGQVRGERARAERDGPKVQRKESVLEKMR